MVNTVVKQVEDFSNKSFNSKCYDKVTASLAGSYNRRFVFTASGYQGAKRAKGAFPYRAKYMREAVNSII